MFKCLERFPFSVPESCFRDQAEPFWPNLMHPCLVFCAYRTFPSRPKTHLSCSSNLSPCLCASVHLITPTASISSPLSLVCSRRWKSRLNLGCILSSAIVISMYSYSLQQPTTSSSPPLFHSPCIMKLPARCDKAGFFFFRLLLSFSFFYFFVCVQRL